MWTKQSCQWTFSLHVYYGFLPGHKKIDATNPDAKVGTCNGCFLQICFPATCPDLSCIGQSIILPIAFKDPPPWLFQTDIGSTILRWEEGSQWTMARWWNIVANSVLSCAHGGTVQTVLQVLVPAVCNLNQVGRFSEINDMMMDCNIAGSNCNGSAKQSDLRTPWCTP